MVTGARVLDQSFADWPPESTRQAPAAALIPLLVIGRFRTANQSSAKFSGRAFERGMARFRAICAPLTTPSLIPKPSIGADLAQMHTNFSRPQNQSRL